MPAQVYREHQYIIFEETTSEQSKMHASSPLIDSEYEVKHFSGLSLGQKNIIDGNFSLVDLSLPSVAELSDTMGEWIAIAEKVSHSGREFIIFSDAFGYGSVFYASVGDNKFAISDTFHGIASALHDLNVPITVDWGNYLASLSSRMSYFQNTVSDHTMVSEIKLLRPDQLIRISASGISFHSRSEIGTALSSSDYQWLIDKGLELSYSILNQIAADSDSSRRITLSGGVDSRLVLAMLAKSGQHSEYRVHSVDPRRWHNPNTKNVVERDIEIADHIRRDYGLSWWSPGSRHAITLGLREALAIYQSHRSNLYYSFSPSSMLTIQDRLLVTLRGGGGEILSSTAGGNRLAEAYSKDGLRSAPADWFSKHLTKSSQLLPEYKEITQDYLADVYKKFQGATLRQTYDNFYFNTRNRVHFGHLHHSRITNELALQFLSNPFFLGASRLLASQDRENGRLVQDLFEASEPQLLKYLFDSSEWTERLISRPNAVNPVKNEWQTDYDMAHSASDKLRFVAGHEPNKQTPKPDMTVAGTNFLKSVFALIEDLVDPSQRTNLHAQHRLVIRKVAERRLNLFHVLAKAASLLDGFTPQPTLGAQLIHRCSTSTPETGPDSRTVTENMSAWRDPLHDIPVFQHEAELLQLSEGELQVTTNLIAEYGNDYSYAFYLLKDGERIAQRWYDNDPEAIFETPVTSGTYQAIAHVRYKSRPLPAYYVKSNPLTVTI